MCAEHSVQGRPRSETAVQSAVDRLLLILKTVNDVIHTAEWQLVKDLLRPVPVLGMPLPPGWSTWPDPSRAYHRTFRITRYPGWVWGYEGYEEDRTTRHNLGWGTIQ